MKTSLIVLIDFSPYAQSLLQLATAWADILKAELLLVHKVAGHVPAMASINTKSQLLELEKKEAYAKLTALAEQHTSSQLPIRYFVTKEALPAYLNWLQGKEEDSLIMLGLKGTGLLKQIFIGSTLTEIIDELNHTTVAVPLTINSTLPARLIIALHYKYGLNEQALEQLIGLFSGTLKAIEFISVVAEEDREADAANYLSGLQERYQHQLPSSYTTFRSNNSFEEVKAYLADHSQSILVVQKGSRSLVDHLFRRFFVREVVEDGAIPLIVLPTPTGGK